MARPLVKVVKMGGGTRQYGSAHMLAKALLYSMIVGEHMSKHKPFDSIYL